MISSILQLGWHIAVEMAHRASDLVDAAGFLWLVGVQVITSEACCGRVEAAAEIFPDASGSAASSHFNRNVFSHVLRAKLRALRLTKPAELVEAKAQETLTYFAFRAITK